MSLNVILYQTSGTIPTNPISFKADQVEHSINRSPNQIGLPADDSGHQNQIFTIDLGMTTEQITCSGLCNSVGSTGSSADLVDVDGSATKAGLENAARTWWAFGDVNEDLPGMVIDGSYLFRGHIKSVTFSQAGALEDRWQFALVFIVRFDVGYNPTALGKYAWINSYTQTFNTLRGVATTLWTDNSGYGNTTNSYGIIIGKSAIFDNVQITLSNANTGAYSDVTWSYWSGAVWTPFTPTDGGIGNFNSNGTYSITWSALAGWTAKTINSGNAYYIRITQSNGSLESSDYKTGVVAV